MAKKSSSRGRKPRGLSVYSNLTSQRKQKKDGRSRKKAEYLAKLPKQPLKRFFYRLKPKNFFAYWFSREGGIMALKIAGVAALVGILTIGALFAYYRRELDAIRPSEINKRVQSTVTKYYDRNGILLWEDTGTGNYQLVVESDAISKYMKEATVAIEDKDFYKHNGISITGLARAAINNVIGQTTQGGSTLTQQLVKQVFLADEAYDRGIGGIPRKIKEAILAIEIERMYNKDQILTLYLNESPYGGRRNGVESAAQTYFGKPASQLNLAESAFLAGIPQDPSWYDPYNPEGHADLITRQHVVLNAMADQGYISKDEAAAAKKVAILDTVKPESDTLGVIRAPHFLTSVVRNQLEKELGAKTVGNGGMSVTTTLDWRVQEVLDKAMNDLFASNLPRSAGFDNGAATIMDSQTGQILGMRGSRDFAYPGYGQENAAMALIQPGSSIKPFVYASLFKNSQEFGAGSILSDENIDSLVGYDLNNFDNKFRGNISIRSGLAESRNIPAVKAYYIAGRENVLDTIHAVGDKSYCTDGVEQQASAALAIGGCGLRQVEHVNAFATLARMGEYKEPSSILKVENGQGQVIKEWKDEGKQVLDPQIPFILSDILSDDAARAPSFGFGAAGLNVPGVKTATKTGTSNLGNSSKDLWMMSYSPKAVMGIWVGNHIPAPMNNALSSIVGPTVSKVMGSIHKDIFQKDGTWKPGDWFKEPAGIQRINANGRTDLYPSWYKKPTTTGQNMTFDKVSKKKATQCTPATAKIDIQVQRYIDPVTKKETFMAPDGYDATKDDDLHKCTDVMPTATVNSVTQAGSNYSANITYTSGTHALTTLQVMVNGSVVSTVNVSSGGTQTVSISAKSGDKVSAKVIDAALYEATSSPVTVSGNVNS